MPRTGQRTVRLPRQPDPGRLYGDLCAVLPPQYAVGQGYSLDTLRFAVEDGARLELRLSQGEHHTRTGRNLSGIVCRAGPAPDGSLKGV